MAVLLTALSVAILLAIVGHIFLNGFGSLDSDFFTKIPKPYGESGGGIAQAILGTLTMLLVAALIAVPVGVGTAIYIVEFGNGRFAEIVDFVTSLSPSCRRSSSACSSGRSSCGTSRDIPALRAPALLP